MVDGSSRRLTLTGAHAVTSIAYVLVLLSCEAGLMPSFPVAIVGSLSIFIYSIVVATMTFPVAVLVVRNGYGFVGSVVCGALGAFAGRGALALATLSSALGWAPSSLLTVFLVAEILAVLSLTLHNRMGRLALGIEVTSTVALALMSIAPMACFMILNPL